MVPGLRAADPNCHNIEANIEKMEDSMKEEHRKYARMVANRLQLESQSSSQNFERIMRHEADRLLDFDPNFDLPSQSLNAFQESQP